MLYARNLDVGHSQSVRLQPEHLTYLKKCARIRDITVHGLLSQLLYTISKDQLVGAVLDDDGQRCTTLPRYRQRKRRYQGEEYPL